VEIADAVHRGVTLDIWNPPAFDDFSDEDADEDADAAKKTGGFIVDTGVSENFIKGLVSTMEGG
jgi:hypothetical protein